MPVRVMCSESTQQKPRLLLRMSESARAQGFDAVFNVRLETSRLANAGRDGKGTAGVEMIAFGTDYSVEPLPPLEGIYAAVTRKDRMGEEGDGWFPDQKLTAEEAIELYTLGSAYAQFMEDRKGMIKEGYLADMAIFDRDFMTEPEEEIMQAEVDYTIVGGKVVYNR